MPRHRLAASAAALLLAASQTPAEAQSALDPTDPDAAIDGVWAFETEPFDGGCVITGQMMITAEAGEGDYRAEFDAVETCPWRRQGGADAGDQAAPLSYATTQSAQIRRVGPEVRIDSALLTVDPPTDLYAPDDFVVYVQSETLMIGELRSADLAPVTFYRPMGLVS